MTVRSATYSPLMWGGMAAVVGVVAIVGILVWNARDAARLAAERGAFNLIELINSDISRNIELYDKSLQGVIALEKSTEFSDLPANARHAIKFGPLITTRALGAMLLLDRQGHVTDDSISMVPRSDNFADRDYFKYHVDNTSDHLYVGYLVRPRFEDRQPRLIISRRISGPSGQFDGVAVSGMRIAYFDRLLKNLKIDDQSTVSVLHADGTLLARRGSSTEGDMVGQNFSRLPNFAHAMEAASGTFRGNSRLDGIEREYVFSRVGDYPLVVVIGLSLREVYQSWERASLVICGATAALCMALMAWLHRIQRELLERRSHLTRANLMARTDGLTQLPNRRYFDERLARERQASAQSGLSLSVLLIDADHFKSVNDRFGHQAGDQVLKTLAQLIRDNLDQPRYFGARYGGEEFAVLLPDTPQAGVALVAERIRAAVEAMAGRADAQGMAAVPVTVSIGLAHTHTAHESAEALVERADAALYRAKHEGRNRVNVAT
ncbi:diguanylate cyclase [Xylophilus sp. Kf1]|nr:diguanylate cyclase [Xylophilus sp. Kf1]